MAEEKEAQHPNIEAIRQEHATAMEEMGHTHKICRKDAPSLSWQDELNAAKVTSGYNQSQKTWQERMDEAAEMPARSARAGGIS